LSNLYARSFFSNDKSQYVVLILDNINTNVVNLTRLMLEYPQESYIYFRRGFNYYLLRNFTHATEDFNSAIKYSQNVNSKLVTLSYKYIENCKVFSNGN